MNKKKILKIIGLIFLLIIVVILIHTVRNYIIITDLQEKISKYSDSTNYHIKSIAKENEKTVTFEYYKKDNREVVFLENKSNEEVSKTSMYNNGRRVDIFWDNKDNKEVELDSGTTIAVNFYNYTETDNKWQTFLGSIGATVKSTDYKGKECYIIKGFFSNTSLSFEDAEIYIEKDTGLFVKTIEEKRITEREYDFNNVNDSIFIEPDISEYNLKIKE